MPRGGSRVVWRPAGGARVLMLLLRCRRGLGGEEMLSSARDRERERERKYWGERERAIVESNDENRAL